MAKQQFFQIPRLIKLFQLSEESFFDEQQIATAEGRQIIPQRIGRRQSWSLKQIPQIGQKFGFLKVNRHPIVATVFVTKGGVLKTSLTLNLARMAALHNVRTCVLGLDMQGDISAALGFDAEISDEDNLQNAMSKIDAIRGLPEVFFNQAPLEDLIQKTDIPNLDYIPETPELVSMEQAILHKPQREQWLKRHVVQPLKDKYDLIIIDASPNWNQLITNALCASDLLISPLECRINNFRNLKMFRAFIEEFKTDLNLHFQQVYVPTKVNLNRKLSQEILSWYQQNLSECTSSFIRESLQGEESMALCQSISEYAPGSSASIEMNRLLHEVWQVLQLKSEELYNREQCVPKETVVPNDLVP